MTKIPIHPKNADGDFYVEDGCCVACDLPRTEAPENFKYLDNHCYVCKQPSSSEELDAVLSALEVQDIDCIWYKGEDKNVLDQIKSRGLQSNVDKTRLSLSQRVWFKIRGYI